MKTITKTGPVHATVTAPPSKSYSVRALLLAAMANGTTTVRNCLDADDTRYALEALRTIGFDVAGSFQQEVFIGPRKSMSANEVPIFIGNAGTAMRFFTGWLAFTPGRFLLQGEERMHERPIGDLVDVLLQIGGGKPQLELHELESTFTHDGIEITPLPVAHGDWTILGFRIGGFAYITDTNGIPAESRRLLEGVDVLALDGLRPAPNHPTHFTVPQAVACAKEIGARETWLLHLAHEVDHEETEAMLPDGIRIAYDGLVVEV